MLGKWKIAKWRYDEAIRQERKLLKTVAWCRERGIKENPVDFVERGCKRNIKIYKNQVLRIKKYYS